MKKAINLRNKDSLDVVPLVVVVLVLAVVLVVLSLVVVILALVLVVLAVVMLVLVLALVTIIVEFMICDIVVGLLATDAVFDVNIVGVNETFKTMVVPEKVEK